MHRYWYSVWSQLRTLIATLLGKAPEQVQVMENRGEPVHGLSREALDRVHATLRTREEIEAVRAYFRQIGLIMRYQRWIKPGEPISQHLRRALDVFAAVERQYAQCGFRPMMPLNRLFEASDEPAAVVAAGYVARRIADEKPVFYARAVLNRMEKLASQAAVATGV